MYASADVTVSKSYKQLYFFIGKVGVFNVCGLCNTVPTLLYNSGKIPRYLPGINHSFRIKLNQLSQQFISLNHVFASKSIKNIWLR